MDVSDNPQEKRVKVITELKCLKLNWTFCLRARNVIVQFLLFFFIPSQNIRINRNITFLSSFSVHDFRLKRFCWRFKRWWVDGGGSSNDDDGSRGMNYRMNNLNYLFAYRHLFQYFFLFCIRIMISSHSGWSAIRYVSFYLHVHIRSERSRRAMKQ